jgi:hypothetical protein
MQKAGFVKGRFTLGDYPLGISEWMGESLFNIIGKYPIRVSAMH